MAHKSVNSNASENSNAPDESRDFRKTVCIVGAGVAGLVSAKVLKHDGFDVTVFDKESTIGGVWAKSRAYPGLRSNNPRETYSFSDFRYPESADDFPTAGQILSYLQSYKEHFGLDPHIQLETEVVSVARREVSHETSPETSRETSHGATRELSRETSHETSREASHGATRELSRETSHETSRETSHRAGREHSSEIRHGARREVNREASYGDRHEVSREARRGASSNSGQSGYRVTVRPVDEPEKSKTLEFDHVVICNGVFSEPNIPQIEGLDTFGGEVVHSSQFTNKDMVRDKRVVVVGAGKSALDCAAFAAQHAASATLVFRKPHWMIPRYFGRKRVDYQLFNRFSEQIFPVYHNASKTKRIVRKIASPLFWLWRKAVNRIVVWQSTIPQIMRPDVSVISGIENNGIGTEFYDILQKGLADTRRASIASVRDKNRLALDNGEQLEADIVIFATGWRQKIDFLEPDLKKKIQNNGWFQLYRHILPPEERDLAFVGYASSGNSPLTSEISAHWVSRYFRGELQLPDAREMEREIDKVRRWTQKVFPRRSQGYFIGAYISNYIDELMTDMGLQTRRKDNFISEYFEPFWAERYERVKDERSYSK